MRKTPVRRERAVQRTPRAGFVLIVALGMLALLSVLSLSFVTVASMEMNIAGAFCDQVRARMVAEAGIEWAVGELRRFGAAQPFSTPPERTVPAPWADPMFFHDETPGDDAAAPPACARVLGMGVVLRGSTRPSFQRTGANPQGQVVSGYQGGGYLPGQYETMGDFFRLKVFDSTQQLNLNSAATDSLKLMWGNLGTALYDVDLSCIRYLWTDPAFSGNPLYAGKFPAALPGNWAALIDAIILYRDNTLGGAFAQKDQIAGVPGMTAQVYALIKDYVSVSGFPDDSVMKPLPAWPGGAFYAGTAATHPALVRQPLGRYPINLNSAPPEILTAVLASIHGRFLSPAADSAWPSTYRGKYPYKMADGDAATATREATVSFAAAKALAIAIVNRRRATGPFTSWRDFRTFLDGQKTTNAGLGANVTKRQDVVDMVWANCNPNTLTNRTNPDLSHRWAFEKLSLTPVGGATVSNTTEFCLCGRGTYDIESLGRVFDDRGRQRGEYQLSSTVQVFDVVRHTTQKDFATSSAYASGNVSSSNLLSWPEPMRAGVPASELDGCLRINPAAIGAAFPFLPENSPNAFGATLANQKKATSVFNLLPATDWGDVVPDGLLCLRQRGRQIRYSGGVLNADQGTIELWVKLLAQPDDGSDEPLLYTVAPKAKPPVAQAGVTWKLERFGKNLVSTRFWWVNPASSDPKKGEEQQSPYSLTYSEWSVDIGSWQPGTWHHVVHRWSDGITQTALAVDGSPAPGAPFTVSTADTKIDLGTTTETSEDKSTSPPTMVIKNTHHWKFINYTMGSNDIPAAGTSVICIGGYTYNQDASKANIKNTGVYPSGSLFRGMNGTVDNVHVDGSSGYAISLPRFRYGAGTSATLNHNGMDMPQRIEDARVAAGGRLPILSAAITLYKTADPRAAGVGSAALTVGGVTVNAGAAADGGPVSAPGGPVFLTQRHVPYTLTIAPGGSVYDSPVVDDVTLYIGVPTRFFTLVPVQEP